MRYSKILVMVWIGLLIGLLPYEVVAKDYNFVVRVKVNKRNVEADGVEISPKSGGSSTKASFVKSSSNGRNIYTARLPGGEYIVKVSKDGYMTEKKEVQIPNKFGEVIVPLRKGKATPSEKEDTSEQPVVEKTHSLLISNLPSGTFEIEINGEKQLVKITDKDVSLDAIKDFHVDTKRRIICEGGHTLDFVRVKPATDNGENVITLSLTDDQAKTFYQQSQELSGSTSPLHPLIFKSVYENHETTGNPSAKVVSEFWIQTETIRQELYQEIIAGGSADKVSYNEAKTVIEALNKKCQGYQFDLPTEEQFVYLARKVYNFVNDEKLKKCQDLKDKETDGIKQLLGNQWQLTQSRCESWSTDLSNPNKQCSDSTSYIKKGGTTESKDATECMPEYRAESTPDLSEPNTTIRLILKQNSEYK